MFVLMHIYFLVFFFMRIFTTLAMFTAMIATSLVQVSAMASNDGAMMDKNTDAMMKKDTLTTDSSMMKHNDMMTGSTVMTGDKMMTTDMTKMSLIEIAKHCGYTWSKDRVKLAKMAGIKNYRGTAKQNTAIRAYLLSDKGMADAATMMKKDSMMK